MGNLIISNNLENVLISILNRCSYDQLFLLSDEMTHELCVPLVRDFPCLKNAKEVVIPAGDIYKTLSSAMLVWEFLQLEHATRHSLLINIGGGMTTDLGGFCASCFKRGINFINVPTSLLAMVDASVGGKTGINFGTIKNEIGLFREATAVIIDTSFLATLDDQNFRSGYSEMLKHALISTKTSLSELLNFNLESLDFRLLSRFIEESIAIKQEIVEQDPTEQGLRKALNVGHTIGHSLEALFIQRELPILHGYAVAFGIVAELYLSVTKMAFPADTMRQVVNFIRSNYGAAPIVCDDYIELFQLMTHDKKNVGNNIIFTLLDGIGNIKIDQTASKSEIFEALDFLREGF